MADVIESIERMPGAEERGCAPAVLRVLKDAGIKAEELELWGG